MRMMLMIICNVLLPFPSFCTEVITTTGTKKECKKCLEEIVLVTFTDILIKNGIKINQYVNMKYLLLEKVAKIKGV